MKKQELKQLIKEIILENNPQNTKKVIADFMLVNHTPIDFVAKQKFNELKSIINWFEIYSKKLQLDENLITTFKLGIDELFHEFIELVNQTK